MRQIFSGILVLCIVSVVGVSQAWAQPQPGQVKDSSSREFVMSCTYGVLAGTMVGAASLAFVDRPADKLNRVARGASIGLYAGILLGVYVVYIVPGMGQSDEDEEDPIVMAERLPFRIYPTLNVDHVDGVQADFTVFRF